MSTKLFGLAKLIRSNGTPVNPADGLATDASQYVSLSTAIDKNVDSIDVAKMSKGGASAAFTTAATQQSGEIDCSGYNSVILHISAVTGTWDISVQGATVTGGTFVDNYDGATQHKVTGVTSTRNILFRGTLDVLKITATNTVAGSITIKAVPINL